MRRKTPVNPPGQCQDQQQAAEGEEHGHCGRPGGFQSGQRNSKHDGQGRAKRRAGGNAQRGAVRQRVPQQSLHRGTAQAQGSTHQPRTKHTGQARPPDDGAVGLPAHFSAEDRAPHVAQGNIHTAEADAQHKRHQRQPRPEGGRAEAHPALLLKPMFQNR